MFKKITKEEALNWILQNCQNRYQLISWEEETEDNLCVFKNLSNERLFSQRFKAFKAILKKRPNHNFASTKEEQMKRAQATILKTYGVENISQLESIKKQKTETCMRNFGVAHPMQNATVLEKSKDTCLKLYGVEHQAKTEKSKQRRKETVEKLYGVKSVSQLKENKEKMKATNLEKYGVEYSSQSNLVKEKVKLTFIKKYGQHPFSNKENIKNILKEKYGVEYPTQNEDIRQRIKQTNIEKYGNEYPQQNEEVKQKIRQTRIDKGLTKIFSGKTVREIALENDISISHCNTMINKYGVDFFENYKKHQTNIENILMKILENYSINFSFNKTLNKGVLKPDFLIEDKKLIIECDGLYWHSDIFKDKNYHKEKKDDYHNNEYSSLFFRENEILNKSHIVESIIKNKLGLNKKIGARKTTIHQEEAKGFLEQNHLMGNGSGRCYTLKHQEDIVAVLQVRWKNKEQKLLEISRFCSKNGLSVVGGFTKLLKHIIKIEQPKQVMTFIDKRYGEGEYLINLGFEKETEFLSFQWTDFENTYHRMTFPKDAGYEKGFFKIWDCGQAKYVMEIE